MSLQKQLMLQANNLNLHLNHQHILQNINLNIHDGDFITIIGPNGAGKTMLLKSLMGLIDIDSQMIIRHQPLNIGYIPQRINHGNLMPISVKRFIALRKKASSARKAEIIEKCHIADLLDHCLSSLSGGELQRVLLARAIMDKPNLLILDEPVQNLDIQGQLAFYRLLDEIYQHNNISIIMVSHDLHMVMQSTQHVVCLYHHICCAGSPQSVAQSSEFSALFGDDMAKMMTIYPHQHDHQHDNCHHD